VKRSGASYECQKEVFLEAVGEEGFAPTALAVHPTTGDLFVSIGGRGTRGAGYRIRHMAGFAALSNGAKLQPMAPRQFDWETDSETTLLSIANPKGVRQP